MHRREPMQQTRRLGYHAGARGTPASHARYQEPRETMPLPALHTPHATGSRDCRSADRVRRRRPAPRARLSRAADLRQRSRPRPPRHVPESRRRNRACAGALEIGPRARRRERALPRRHVQFQPPSARHVLGTRRRRRLALTARNGRASAGRRRSTIAALAADMWRHRATPPHLTRHAPYRITRRRHANSPSGGPNF